MPGGSGATGASPASSVDVDAVLRELQAKNTENLNWKTSIVDLLKLLGLDSSMAARRELAAELHYSGNTEDSAAMNMWLHKEVIRKLAENGGKLPEELRH
jgi:HEAT repeat protein